MRFPPGIKVSVDRNAAAPPFGRYLAQSAGSVPDKDETRLRCIRLRTQKREIIVAPGDGCTLVVLQASASYTDPAAAAEEGEDE